MLVAQDPRNLLDLAVIFSLLTNLIFVQDSHVAGRVARFSDYFVMCVGLPLVLKIVVGRRMTNLLVVLYALAALVVFQNIYTFSDGV